jgi:hypothetical protein
MVPSSGDQHPAVSPRFHPGWFAAEARIPCGTTGDDHDEQQIGLKGSATQVRKIFSPERTRGEILGNEQDDPDDVARRLIDTMMQKDLLSF